MIYRTQINFLTSLIKLNVAILRFWEISDIFELNENRHSLVTPPTRKGEITFGISPKSQDLNITLDGSYSPISDFMSFDILFVEFLNNVSISGVSCKAKV